jgi:hypothetical protein
MSALEWDITPCLVTGIRWERDKKLRQTSKQRTELRGKKTVRGMRRISVRFEVFTAVTIMYAVSWDVTPCGCHIFIALMMEAIRFSEMSLLTRTTRRNIPGDGIHHGHRRENLKFYKLIIVLSEVLWF